MRVLGVHGIGNHRPELNREQAIAQLSAKWTSALADGLAGLGSGAGVEIQCVYYADLLRVPVAQGGDALSNLPAGGEDLIRIWAAELGIDEAVAIQGRPTVPIRIIVDLIAERSRLGSALVRRVVGSFVREVEAYLGESPSRARNESRDAVVRAIREYRPDVVVAHSLGSVVTYEALWSAPDLHVDLLLTLGSPLGMNGVVYQRLIPRQQGATGERPPTVSTWVNIADIGDFVAIPRPFTRRFDPDENMEIKAHLIDFHTARSYLSAKPTAKALLREWL